MQANTGNQNPSVCNSGKSLSLARAQSNSPVVAQTDQSGSGPFGRGSAAPTAPPGGGPAVRAPVAYRETPSLHSKARLPHEQLYCPPAIPYECASVQQSQITARERCKEASPATQMPERYQC